MLSRNLQLSSHSLLRCRRGDVERWRRYFHERVGYVQGDAAIRHADGSYSFHGRSDEVINVGGNRIGTAEIESAILLDCAREGSPVANCAVVGMPHSVLGMAPCAFVVARSGVPALTAADEGRLRSLVLTHVGSSAVPVKFVHAAELPETYSGKYMRKLLRALLTEDAGRMHAQRIVLPRQLMLVQECEFWLALCSQAR